MPNLRDARVKQSYLLVGPSGSGKTTQFLTMPGRKFAWVFDANTTAALAGHDIEWIDLIPDVVGKGLVGTTGSAVLKAGATTSVQVYTEFWRDLRERLTNGFFDSVDSLLLDGLTGMTTVFEEKVLADLGKPAGGLEGREYNMLTREISAALRQITSLDKNLLVCAHRKLVKDGAGNVKGVEPELVGKNVATVPTNFANVIYTICEGDSKRTRHYGYTRNSGLIGDARLSLPLAHIAQKFDMTIEDMSRAGDYGVGKLIKESSK